eukprot:6204918-Pleurochrysis_carterae.AAC.2
MSLVSRYGLKKGTVLKCYPEAKNEANGRRHFGVQQSRYRVHTAYSRQGPFGGKNHINFVDRQ